MSEIEAGVCGVHVHVRDGEMNPKRDRTMTLGVINGLGERFGGDVYIEGLEHEETDQ